MNRNTAYWPERYTPLSLLQDAVEWRRKAANHLDAAAKIAALEHLQKNAGRAAERAKHTPSAANLNAAGSIGNLVADGAAKLAEELAALDQPCPEPPCFSIVYREPEVDGLPENWVAEVYAICGHERIPVLRTWSGLRAEDCRTKAQAIADLRELARHPDLIRQAKGSDYHAARIRAAGKCALECEPTEVRIRAAGADRPRGGNRRAEIGGAGEIGATPRNFGVITI
jgi:hypothetical protein